MASSEEADEQFEDLSYEESYARLQEILERLEAADLPLADSLELYEKGVKLASRCGVLLEEAELRVSKWQPDGNLAQLGDSREQ